MAATAEKRLNVDEFLSWANGLEGNWELYDGIPVMMSPERAGHTATKFYAAMALHNAIHRASVPCQAYPEGMTIRIAANRAFVPDALVVCPGLPVDVIAISNPLIVVEVLSPSTLSYDHGIKLEGYFSLPSLAHYLILDADRRVVIHHARGRDDVIETRILNEGLLRLDPPGLDLAVAELFVSA